MNCPFCNHDRSRVVDSRIVERGAAIRRRRECSSCEGRFTTIEKSVLLVVKRNGVTEPFSRDKVITGVRRACQGRDVSDDELKVLAQQVEQKVRSHGSSQIHANEIGLAILDPLRELDEVAYLRFASVYKSFEDAEDFEREIRLMRRRQRD
ncbi:transcriptional regulator NrdR [Corynebacterium renale]|uniref:transcriptional regulator NrdR n=1 Tax=Corynebacterium renale TaxID=1724 RepID=UPI000DA35CA2|nr:transcriptional regulator NrdR [Corynebacterium renale]SQG64840.1 transcriptional regulator NrdR [Corynebacterium renale]